MKEKKQLGNVLLIGNSGVGKSTLINAVLGEDVAVTGWGTEGTTKELKIYGDENNPFRVIDTIGFEPSYIKQERAIRAVKKWTKESAKEGNENSQINVIWFCVSGTAGKLFERTIKDLLRATSFYKSVPIITVITKSYSLPDREINIQLVNDAFSKQKKTVNRKQTIPVVAKSYTINDDFTVEPSGITELIDATNDCMPEGLKAAAKDLAEYKLDRKSFFAHSIVVASTAVAATVGAVNIAIPDAIILTPLETTEINGLATVYGINKNDQGKRFLNSIIEVGTVSAGAKEIIKLVKLIPGLHIAGAAINAVIAGLIVGGLGEAAIYAFEQVYLGNKSVDDIDWLKKIVENKMLERVKPLIDMLPQILEGKVDTKEIVAVISNLFAYKNKKVKSKN